jgi:hypothetical protein
MQMIICILGSGYVSKKAAQDLIEDFIEGYDPGPVTFMIPSYIASDGLKNVRDAVKEMNHVIVSYKRSVLPEMFRAYQDSSKAVFILDADTDREFLRSAGTDLIYDLSKGLYPVSLAAEGDSTSQMPLDGSVSHAETRTGPVRYDGKGQKENGSESLTEPYRAILQSVTDLGSFSDDQLRRLKEIIMVHIKVHEKDMHPVYETSVTGEKPEDVLPGFASASLSSASKEMVTATEAMYCSDTLADTVKYWKSKRGKFRKAGNSKPRPGETEVFLTEEEAAKL